MRPLRGVRQPAAELVELAVPLAERHERGEHDQVRPTIGPLRDLLQPRRLSEVSEAAVDTRQTAG